MSLLDELRAKGVRVVEGEGLWNAKLTLVGEALGETEERLGKPFCGPAGYFLDNVLSDARVSRSNLYVTNVVPIRPKDNNLENLKLLGLTVESFYPALKERLERHKPNCCIALGGVALKALCNLDGITQWRGSILESSLLPGLKVVPAFHPSHILRMGDQSAKKEVEGKGGVKYDYGSGRVSLVLDVKRGVLESCSPILSLPTYDLIVQPTYSNVVSFLNTVLSSPFTAFDIETRGSTVVCISFSVSPTSAISIPLTVEYWGPSNLELIWSLLRNILWNHPGLVAQNGAFDMTYLQPFAPVQTLHFDTMLAHHLLYPELPHGLDFLCSTYTRVPYYKWMGPGSSGTQLWKYNAMDACVTYEVMEREKEELKEKKLEDLFYGFTMPLMHNVLKMGWRGISVDQEKQKELKEELEKQIGELQERLKVKTGRELNTRSNKQMCGYLYDELKLQKQFNKKEVGGFKQNVLTVDETALQKLTKKYPQHAVLFDLILSIVEKRTLLSNFVNKQLDYDGRWRTSYSVSGTDVGRLSSRKTVFGTGSNLQNIPRGGEDDDPAAKLVKRMMVADPGCLLVEADKSQAEARYVAWYANDSKMKEIFRSGKDIHIWNASILFETVMEKVTPNQRQFAKKIVHAFNYGLGPNHLVDLVLKEMKQVITVAQAKKYIAQYFSGCPDLVRWHLEIDEQLRKTRTLVNAFGRTRQFFGRFNEDMCRKGYAYLPSSTNVDDINHGLNRLDILLPEGANLLLQVHDSLLVMCKEDQVEEVVKAMYKALLWELTINGDTLTVPIEVKVGECWGEMEKVKEVVG